MTTFRLGGCYSEIIVVFLTSLLLEVRSIKSVKIGYNDLDRCRDQMNKYYENRYLLKLGSLSTRYLIYLSILDRTLV